MILGLGVGILLLLLFPLDLIFRRHRSRTPSHRVDERDVIFSRMARRPGTAAYRDYYRRHPELQTGDDRLREMPRIGTPGGRYHNPTVNAEAREWFSRIESITADEPVVAEWVTRIRQAGHPGTEVKAMVRDLGAVAVGFSALDSVDLYTHKGRFDDEYGKPVRTDITSAIVFLVEMDHEVMQLAPRAEVLRESARQYYRAARVALNLTEALRRLGYRAAPQYDAHYDAMLPPLAVAAGLGELGRHNILVADRHGSRVRIGAVATDMPLCYDTPRWLAVEEFCRICRKCATSCPSGALATHERELVRGVSKWPTAVERCYRFWRTAGTDCGICMAACPFSHRDTWFHNIVRRLLRLNPWIRWLAFQGETLAYGTKWRVFAPRYAHRA